MRVVHLATLPPEVRAWLEAAGDAHDAVLLVGPGDRVAGMLLGPDEADRALFRRFVARLKAEE